MKIGIRQVRGESGVDVWAKNLCQQIQLQGLECQLDLCSPIYQFVPVHIRPYSTVEKKDIIHSNSWNGFLFKEDCPLVVTEHLVVHDPAFDPYRTVPQRFYHKWIRHCEEKSFRAADSVVCVSHYAKKKLEEIFGYSSANVIYNGIDTSLFKPKDTIQDIWDIPEDKTVLFFSGNLIRRKGADILPAIMDELGERFVLFIATGQRRRSFAGRQNIINVGHLTLNQLVNLYNRCDIFISATRLEGFGLSIAEAMACGKPVVATNCSSIPELLIDQKGGFLCGIDDVKDFAEKIAQLSTDPEQVRSMGDYNRKRVTDLFTLEKMTDNYIKLYQRLLK